MTAVITGLGVVAPTGVGVDQHWMETLHGTGRIGPITSFDARRSPIRLAGEVTGFDETEFVNNRLRVQTDRWTWMGLAATRMALEDAELDPAEHEASELSIVTASASGGNAFGQREIHALWREGPSAVSAYQSIGWFYAATSGQVSIQNQLKGPCGVLVADSAGGIDAVAQATRLLRRGSKAVVVGGTEAPLSPYALACQSGQPLSTDPDPATAYRPFASDSTGYVPGEGGAMLVVEDGEWARERGAPAAYAEIAATAATHDAYHPTEPPPSHDEFARAMRMAVAKADLWPSEIDVIFADGSGDPRLDRLEAAAINEVFGPGTVPVTVPKTSTGRLYSGAAALDLSWASLALAYDVIPSSINVDSSCIEDGLDLVTTARSGTGLRTALVLARGAGGFNSAAVLRLPNGGSRRCR